MESNPWFITIAVSVCSILASSGFWAYMMKKSDKNDVKTEMLVGLAHDRIVYLGMYYLNRGDYITQDEYENLHDYLYVPYSKLGGNGSAKRVMQEVDRKLKLVRAEYEADKHD